MKVRTGSLSSTTSARIDDAGLPGFVDDFTTTRAPCRYTRQNAGRGLAAVKANHLTRR
jgi:hypothetical protein